MRHVSFFLSHHHPVNACTYTQVHTHTHTPPTKNRKGLHIQFICKTWCRRSWFQKTKNLKMDIFIPKFLLYLPHSNDVCVWVCAHVCVCMCVCVHACTQKEEQVRGTDEGQPLLQLNDSLQLLSPSPVPPSLTPLVGKASREYLSMQILWWDLWNVKWE